MYKAKVITDKATMKHMNKSRDLGISDLIDESYQLECHMSHYDDPGVFTVYRLIRKDGTTLKEVKKKGHI